MLGRIDEIAETGYGFYREHHPDHPEWSALRNQHTWRDLAQTYINHPNPTGGPANDMEECVQRAVLEAAQPAEALEDVVEEVVEEVAPEPIPEKAPPKKKTTH